VETIENLEENKNLETLDLAKNRLKAIANLEKLELLEELWLNHNGVDDWKNIELLKVNKASRHRIFHKSSLK